MVANSKSATTVLLLFLMLAGTLAASYNLRQKTFWYDEGCSMMEIIAKQPTASFGALKLPSDQLLPRQRVLEQASVSKHKAVSPAELVRSLSVDAKQVPLFYFILRGWSSLFGYSIEALRSLSVLFAVLQIPAMYWFCLQLFKSKRIALLASGLMPLSPFWLNFAQEARSYSLWALLILVSSALLLRAVRQNNAKYWISYLVSIVLSLYTQLLTIPVLAGQLGYNLLSSRLRLSRPVLVHLAVLAVTTLSFAPWLMAGLSRNGFSGLPQRASRAVDNFAGQWFSNLTSLYSAFAGQENLSSALIVLLEFIAVAVLCLRKDKEARNFLLPMIACSILPMLIPDLVSGGSRSVVVRYVLASFLGIFAAVAALLAAGLGSHKRSVKAAMGTVLFFLLSMQLFSCIAFYRSELKQQEIAPIPRNKNAIAVKMSLELAAAELGKMDRPVCVFRGETQIAWIAALLQSSPSATQCLFVVDTNNLIPDGYEQVLLCDYPGKSDLSQLQDRYAVKNINPNLSLLTRKQL